MSRIRALFPGRFQPFHNGHLKAIEQLANENDEVVIAISAAQFNYLESDPFTSGERVYMIHSALKEAGFDLSRFYIVSILNVENNATYVSNLKSYSPYFDVVYSTNPLVLKLLDDAGIKVKSQALKERELLSGTEVRAMILKGEDWEFYVPAAVAILGFFFT